MIKRFLGYLIWTSWILLKNFSIAKLDIIDFESLKCANFWKTKNKVLVKIYQGMSRSMPVIKSI